MALASSCCILPFTLSVNCYHVTHIIHIIHLPTNSKSLSVLTWDSLVCLSRNRWMRMALPGHGPHPWWILHSTMHCTTRRKPSVSVRISSTLDYIPAAHLSSLLLFSGASGSLCPENNSNDFAESKLSSSSVCRVATVSLAFWVVNLDLVLSHSLASSLGSSDLHPGRKIRVRPNSTSDLSS